MAPFKAFIASLGLVGFASGAILPKINSYPGHNLALENRTLDEIYAAAKNETGELVVLWGGDAVSQGDSTIAAWKSRFPDIKLNLTVDVSKYHDSRVNRQFQRDGTDGADIAVLQTLHDYGRWKREGRLLPYKPLNWEDVYSSVKDPEGAFLGVFIYQFGSFVYNKESLKASDLPSTYDELTNPFWKNKLVLTQPNDDDAITYLFSTIIETYGWEWFEDLQKQNVKWVRGTGEPANYVAETNTSRVLSFTTNLNGANNIANQPVNDSRILWPQTAAIFASTPRPESSRLFLSWLLSDEHQQTFGDSGSYLIRKDLKAKAGSVWDDPYTALTEFATFMENRDLVEWWRLQFETSLGVAKGVSPVESFFGKMHAKK
ncbi:uncharacterized protein N7511_001395 [Penicillium nucicola]|uniref:uncharacterized protein n=1 Tax=Penicillium nucicola TaxID=1850975 RepID=UPI002545461A|nr:uncharacterized protein N7511_001395 [Penicillium nucicola]KAJ5776384.1 hypothetical protein N7511_001395 [Penicillium nucicola]